MLDVLVPTATALVAFLREQKGEYTVELTGAAASAAGGRLIGAIWTSYRGRRNEDFERLAAAALEDAAKRTSAYQEENWRRPFSWDSHQRALAAVRENAMERFLKRHGAPERAVLDALLLGRFEGLGEELASMLGPDLVPETLPQREKFLGVLTENFIRSFSTLLKTEVHRKGRLAFHRDLAWATHHAISRLTDELAPLIEVDWKAVLKRLDDIAEGRVDPPDFESHYQTIIARLRSIEAITTRTEAIATRTEVAVSDLSKEMAEMKEQLTRLGVNAGEDYDRLKQSYSDLQAAIQGLLKEILKGDVDPTRLGESIARALARIQESRAEVKKFRPLAAWIPKVMRTLSVAELSSVAAERLVGSVWKRYQGLPNHDFVSLAATALEIAARETASNRKGDWLNVFWRDSQQKALADIRKNALERFLKPAPERAILDSLLLGRFEGLGEELASMLGPDLVPETLPQREKFLSVLTENFIRAFSTLLKEDSKGSKTFHAEMAWTTHHELSKLQRELAPLVPVDWTTTLRRLDDLTRDVDQIAETVARTHEQLARLQNNDAEATIGTLLEALKEYTRERLPLEWAMTQNNLGNALSRLAERASGTTHLEAAVAAYREALKEYTRERLPLEWAMTQNNLGNALSRLAERESGTERLEQAVSAYRSALEELSEKSAPDQYTLTSDNLRKALTTLEKREKH